MGPCPEGCCSVPRWERWLIDWMFVSQKPSAPEVNVKIKEISVPITKICYVWVLGFLPVFSKVNGKYWFLPLIFVLHSRVNKQNVIEKNTCFLKKEKF